MDKYEVEGRLTDDCMSISLLHGNMLKRMLRKWKDKDLQITIEPLKRKRSDRQNRYMWGVIVKCVQAWFLETNGIKYTENQIYTWLRLEILGEKPEIVTISGREVIMMTGKRFSEMSTAEFAEAVDTILNEMAQRGCVIQEPHRENLLSDFVNVKDE